MTADFQRCVILIRAAACENFDECEGVPVFLFKFGDIILQADVFPLLAIASFAGGGCQQTRSKCHEQPRFSGWVDHLPSSKNTSLSFCILGCCCCTLIPVHHSNPTHTQRCLHLSNFLYAVCFFSVLNLHRRFHTRTKFGSR